MTVGTKMHQTLVSCESILANLKSFALDTDNQQAKQMYGQLANTMENQIISSLRTRVNEMEQQEPQFKVFQQGAQQQVTQQASGVQQSAATQQTKPQAQQNKKY